MDSNYNPTSFKKMNQEQILELLGVEAVILPIFKGSKAPKIKGWSNITFAETQQPAYQQKFQTHGNAGVLLGKASQNLCSIDFDDDDALAYFLKLNPSLETSLRTRGKRGANIWVVVEGDYPTTFGFKDSQGNPAGEWRADGGQTVISGTHPEGNKYQILVGNPPMRIAYNDINWGDLSTKDSEPSSSKCHIDDIDDIKHKDHTNDTKIQSIQKNSKVAKVAYVVREKRAESARRKLKKDKGLQSLYNTFIKRRFMARQGERNSQVVSMTTFLFRAVGEKRVLELTRAFHQVNQDLLVDSLEQHQREATSHLRATKERWLSKLPDTTKKIYDGLPQSQSEAFRICMSLAEHECEKCPTGEFFLSAANLGNRLGIDMKKAHRILRQLEAEEAIAIITKGTRHTKKTKGMATRYRWLPPLPEKDSD